MMGSERRIAPRIPLAVPLQVKWTNDKGQTFEERTETEVLNSKGARVRLMNAVELGCEVDVVNLENREAARARVVWAGEYFPGQGQRVGIEFTTFRSAFWGS
ncbi:MAG TPA: hypothetical protein VNN18_03060 [Candidatus Xenobia bacterium]|nr:hypothetical protein [Candidatus Xenobia bacterium]